MGVRHPHSLAVEARYAFEHMGMGPWKDLPAKVSDAIRTLMNEEARISNRNRVK